MTGLCRMFGTKLMPRMRGLGDVTFHRPAKGARFAHIDAPFTSDINWGPDHNPRAGHDPNRAVHPSRAGPAVDAATQARKLGTYNRRSLLYHAFRELGRVERTLFLLRFFSSMKVRRIICAETTKTEAYNDSSTGCRSVGR